MSSARPDGFDLPITTTSDEAAASYREGVDRLLAGEGGSAPLLAAALARDERLALAHVALAIALDEEKDAAGAKAHRQRARELAAEGGVTERERDHVELLTTLAAGPDPRGMTAARAHMAAYPKDGLVLDVFQRHLFFHGGAGRRQTLVELFEALAPAWRGHWYADAKLALHLEETGALARAEELAERSYALRPRNASAIHALIHIAHAAHNDRDGAQRLAEWLGALDAKAPLHGHLWWHVALMALADGDFAGARALYDERVRPARSSGTRQLALADAVGLLWSWSAVSPMTVPSWDEAIVLAREFARSPGRPFLDVHVAVAFLAQQDRQALAELLRAIGDSPHPLARTVSLPLVSAIALVLDDAAAAFRRLSDLDTDAMGGSNVERALLDEVTLHAAHRAGVTIPVVTGSPHPIVAQIAR